jgi:hypothetical protein
MKDKETAIDWILKEINERGGFIFTIHYEEVFAQAKQMEKEQIIKANDDGALMAYALPFNAPFKKGEEYYNETYGSQAPQRLEEANEE